MGDGSQDVADALERLGRELEQSMQEASEKADAADRILEEMTLEEVLRRMEESGQGPESRETSEDGLRDAGGESEEEYVGKNEGKRYRDCRTGDHRTGGHRAGESASRRR